MSRTTAIEVLVEKLYRRVEFLTRSDRLGNLELDATMWYFRNHGKEPDGLGQHRSQRYRMVEWCLVERRSLAFETSFLEAFIDHEMFRHLTAREQDLALGLPRKRTGVFEVMRAADHGIVVRDLTTQDQLDVRRGVLDVEAGDIVCGTLNSFESAWLISHGSISLRPANRDAARRTVELFQVQHAKVPASIRLEMLIARLLGGVTEDLNDLPPFASAAEARRAEAELMVALVAAGFCDAPPGWTPTRAADGSILDSFEPLLVTDPALLADPDSAFGLRTRRLDVPLTAWLQATRRIVVEGAGGSRHPGRGPGVRESN